MNNYHVLGMTLGHNATAAITNNGRIIACASEERFTREKNVYGYPARAIDYCLHAANLTPQKIDLVVLSSHITPPLYTTSDGLKEQSRHDKPSLNWFSLLSAMRGKINTIKKLDQTGYRHAAPLLSKITNKKRVDLISHRLGISQQNIISSEHHLTHAYTGIFASDLLLDCPHDELLTITVDGEGDAISSSVGIFRRSDYNYKRIATSSYAESIGHFYSAITSYLGMKPLEHEYKVMGLAPYSTSTTSEELHQKLLTYLQIDDTLRITTKIHSHRFEQLFHNLFKGIRFDYVAAAAQKTVETLLVELVKKSIAKTNIHNVILSGGVFMNVKANYNILQLPEVQRLFIMPSCGDESLPIGSCYYGTLLHRKQALRDLQPLTHLYLGPDYSREDIEKTLKHSEFDYAYHGKNIVAQTARILARGSVIARFDGRMEFGARALGNRSILADASDADVVETINKIIKKRDFWMPFAPSIMEEHATKYIKHPELLKKTRAYFMMISFESTPLAQKDLKAAMHPSDKTIRPQLVNKALNQAYYEVLHAFMKKTGRFGILNTSFNIHGEPIVCSPEDALHTLRESGLEYLAIGDYLVRK